MDTTASATDMPRATEPGQPEAGLLDLLGLGGRPGDTQALLDTLLACSAMYPEPRHWRRLGATAQWRFPAPSTAIDESPCLAEIPGRPG